jgi:adenosylcobinamide-phosphate synthase
MSIFLALLIDWCLGEPPITLHPVVWFGNYLKWAERWRDGQSPRLIGGVMFTIGCLIVVSVVGALSWAIEHLAFADQILLTGILLKPAFAFRMLVREVSKIEQTLQQDLIQGQQRLAYIVSRDTTVLSAIEVRESALESLSENLSDSVIAPLFWFAIAGLPGAYLYRFVNTADAMWGYRTEKYEQWGKIAAHSDDLLNWIPARITGLWLYYFPLKTAVRPGTIATLRHEAQKTPSPNSGWSMAAFALRLGVHFSKPGVYTLNPQGEDVRAERAIAGIRWITRSGWVLALLISVISAYREFHGQ